MKMAAGFGMAYSPGPILAAACGARHRVRSSWRARVHPTPSGTTLCSSARAYPDKRMDITVLNAFFDEYWPHLTAVLSLVIGGSAAVHAAMNKQDVRAAIGWVGIIMMSPLVGPLVYLVAGVNRIRHDHISEQRDKSLHEYITDPRFNVADIACKQFGSLKGLGHRISRFALGNGNNIRVLCGGDEAYLAMMEAIDQATRTIALETYIFDNDGVGKKITEALARAVKSGVQVR